jgi:hypothetical protein
VILVNIFKSALDDKHETIIPEKEITMSLLALKLPRVSGFLGIRPHCE